MSIFLKASRQETRLLIGLCGPSGCGKTLSALRLAQGIAGGEKIVVIDTEQGRACQYAPAPGASADPPLSFDFFHAQVAPPFTPARYREYLALAAAEKPAVIIIDSMSHEWEGQGGLLEMVESAKAAGGKDFAVWRQPKADHQKLVNALLQIPAHIVLCMRAKEKRAMVPDPNKPGKQQIVSLGWHPITEPGLCYELTINLLLGTAKRGAPSPIDAFDFGKLPINMLQLIRSGEQITEDTGRALVEWAKGNTYTGDRLDKLETTATNLPAEPSGDKPRTFSLIDESGEVVQTWPRTRAGAADYVEALNRAILDAFPADRARIVDVNVRDLQAVAKTWDAGTLAGDTARNVLGFLSQGG